MKSYERMSKREAAAALLEFLDERPRALEQLTRYLAEHSDGTVHLDETVESLTPLWRWVKSMLTERTAETPEPKASTNPTWLRYSIGTEPTLSPQSIEIIDGVISYLCRVVERGAPQAQWRVGYNRIKSYMWQNHPVLANNNEEVPLPSLVPGLARGQAGGRLTSEDDKFTRTAAAVIRRLDGPDEETVVEDEPLIEVEDLGEDELRGREFEVSLREDIAHEYSREVDRMAKILAKEDGITGVVREDREVLLVGTTTWATSRLEEWLNRYFEEKLRG
ncbi:hypothetical protein [Arthrobacter nitrophenolicus]|uniref:Uncharacterized protein n=1 Tax=Arthrobacter nitrophenolicus TaxID=683150 RepID=A0A4R5Y9B4_9MICC|nr:hypothetical protein [Arthrobacter nitrophenolicus]TDL41389.1 hypothetical protein E2R57_01605 [Arthrobacter nitrophenolicus]